MALQEIRLGRVHNAEGARRAILDAAEEAFARHGFAGARIDRIAALAGYNKSLIFQYFEDKLNLYTEVLKRAIQETEQIRANLLSPLFLDESIASDPRRFKAFLESMVRVTFDFLADHPKLSRILVWEMADGWQTYTRISAQFPQAGLEPVMRVCRKAQQAGLLRSDFLPIVQLTIAQPICLVYLAYLPIYQQTLTGEDLTSPASLARARDYIIDLILAGSLTGPNAG